MGLKKKIRGYLQTIKVVKELQWMAKELAKNKDGNMQALSDNSKGFSVFAMVTGLCAIVLYKFRDAAVKIGGDNVTSLFDALIGNFNDIVFWGGVVLLVIFAVIIMQYFDLL